MTGAPIDMSLRLWSDEIALEPVLRDLGLPLGIIHVRGEAVPPSKSAAPRIAPRHFASTTSQRSSSSEDVGGWMRAILAKIRGDRQLAKLFAARRVEATIWVAILGGEPVPMPQVDESLAEDAASLGVKIFIENYTELDHGNPSRLSLPESPTGAGRPERLRA